MIPVCLDAVEPPFGFRELHYVRLGGSRSAQAAELDVLASVLRERCETSSSEPSPQATEEEVPSRLGSSPWDVAGDEKISIGRMPVSGKYLFGRDRELDQLTKVWEDPRMHILVIVAWGGVGKSCLVNHWLQRNAQQGFLGAERVYAWSFYRQGTSERVTSADDFITSALAWFGDEDPSGGSAWDKGERLAALIQKNRTLLILDGLEVLQYPPASSERRLKDIALEALLRSLAFVNRGLCIVLTRFQLLTLDDFEAPPVQQMALENISPQAGLELLRSLGVQGTDGQLMRMSHDFEGHCLALNLLGAYLRDNFGGEARRISEIRLLSTPDDKNSRHARRILASYEAMLEEVSRADLEVLYLIGLFDRPADEGSLKALRRNPPIPNLADQLCTLPDGQWRRIIGRLRAAGLLANAAEDDPETLDAHPLIREYFGLRLKTENPRIIRASTGS